MEFLHTWALLPQSVYPLDLRSVTIAHTGGDVYGRFNTKKAGSFAYNAYAGVLPDDKRGGYRYGLEDRGLGIIGDIKRHGGGGDLRWTAPLEGLQVGVSHMETRGEFNLRSPQVPIPLNVDMTGVEHHRALRRLPVRELALQRANGAGRIAELVVTPSAAPTAPIDSRGWFVSGAYRIAKPLELGAYYSRYIAEHRLRREPRQQPPERPDADGALRLPALRLDQGRRALPRRHRRSAVAARLLSAQQPRRPGQRHQHVRASHGVQLLRNGGTSS